MIHEAITAAVETILSEKIMRAEPVPGGDINQVYRLKTNSGQYLIKINSASRFPDMFIKEADGLAIIANTGAVNVPQAIALGEAAGYSFLLMDWVEAGQSGNAGMAKLGEGLANLHRNTLVLFGFGEDNYIGSLHQSNRIHGEWSDFYIEERLDPLLKMAVDSGMLEPADTRQFERLYAKLPELFEPESPALLHGDLWSGNFIIDKNNRPYLIDPAVYYGHREMDIAMTMLFGGFRAAFYDAYQYHYPLAKGFEQRLKLWSLYPLLVHVNLFGGGYVQQLRSYLGTYL
jgi:protein-ribulosamine 3-kinase